MFASEKGVIESLSETGPKEKQKSGEIISHLVSGDKQNRVDGDCEKYKTYTTGRCSKSRHVLRVNSTYSLLLPFANSVT